ncbi:MAG: TonB-dependent receptor, partial [bacterium]|nr:TonB-dependent receptor [bacterium]
MRKTLISIVMALLGSTALVFGNDTVDTTVQQLPDSIVVTASRAPSTFSDVTRSVTVIHANELKRTPSLSIADLLTHVPGVDVRRRSVHGVQADIGIRGATSSQTLVLLNGVKLADPQTSHHDFDLPVTPSDIQRIEVLRGGGSRLYGPDAFGGVINVITSQAVGRDLRLSLVQGQHRLSEQTVSAVFPAGPVSHRLSLARRTSEGHRNNTEFDIKNLSYTAAARTGESSFDFSAQYVDKEFGAHRFYSDAFPDEWEATSTLMLSGGGQF